MWVRIKLNYRLCEKSRKRMKQEQNKFKIHKHSKLGQSTKISKNGKISKGVRNTVRKEKEENGEKVDRECKNGRRDK